MNTVLLTISLAEPLVFCEFVEILQRKLHGTHFGSVGFHMLGFDMHIFLTEYLPSLDGWMNFFAAIPISEVSFTHKTKPACIEHLLSAARVLFRCGFDELCIKADEHDALTVSKLSHSHRRLAQSGVS